MGLGQPHNLRQHGSNMQSSMAAVALLALAQVKAQICSLQLVPAQLSLEKNAFSKCWGVKLYQMSAEPCCLFPCMQPQLGTRASPQQQGRMEIRAAGRVYD